MIKNKIQEFSASPLDQILTALVVASGLVESEFRTGEGEPRRFQVSTSSSISRAEISSIPARTLMAAQALDIEALRHELTGTFRGSPEGAQALLTCLWTQAARLSEADFHPDRGLIVVNASTLADYGLIAKLLPVAQGGGWKVLRPKEIHNGLAASDLIFFINGKTDMASALGSLGQLLSMDIFDILLLQTELISIAEKIVPIRKELDECQKELIGLRSRIEVRGALWITKKMSRVPFFKSLFTGALEAGNRLRTG